MKKSVLLFLIICILILTTATTSSQRQLLRTVDALASYTSTDFSAQYTIIQDIPGKGRKKTVAAVFRRDSNDVYTILIMEPETSKGQGYLKQRNTLWFYDPVGRVFNSTSSKDRFQNSNARNSDFTKSTLAEDYEVISEQKGRLGRFDCTILELEANNDQVTYPFTKIWVSDDNLVLKSEDYSLSGQLLRTTLIPKYQKIQDRDVPYQILMVDHLLGANVNGKFVNEKTQITIETVSFEDIPDRVFSKSFLESMSIE